MVKTPEVLGSLRGKLEHLAVINDDYVVGTSKGRGGRNSTELSGAGLYVYDVSTPSNVFEANYKSLDASGLAYQAPYLFMVSHDGKLRVFDFTTPASPELVGEIMDWVIPGSWLFKATAPTWATTVWVSSPWISQSPLFQPFSIQSGPEAVSKTLFMPTATSLRPLGVPVCKSSRWKIQICRFPLAPLHWEAQ